MIFHWSVCDSKSHHVSKNLLNIPTDLDAVVWLILTLLLWLLFPSMWVFHNSIRLWSFTGIWLIASFLKSPGLFRVFWLILTMQFFQAFGGHSKHFNYNWYHFMLNVPWLFQLSSKIQVFIFLFSFILTQYFTRITKFIRK